MIDAFFKCLSDQTRLNILTLLSSEKELCVCELSHALSLSQPKISRHLAMLREHKVLTSHKQGKWIYYQFSSELPSWQSHIIQQTALHTTNEIILTRLAAMSGRPDRASICCD